MTGLGSEASSACVRPTPIAGFRSDISKVRSAARTRVILAPLFTVTYFQSVAIGRTYRTNAEGIRQFKDIVGSSVHVEVAVMPHYKGPSDVFHLMSVISPLDRDLQLVYSPLMPIPFREWLVAKGMQLVEVPDEEFAGMGCNVLTIAPREVVMVKGNPETQRRMESAGCKVHVIAADAISVPGEGGPTCLTRPLMRV